MENSIVKFDGQIVGHIETKESEETVYVTDRDKRTWVKKYNGFGISTEVLKELKSSDIETIEVFYQKSGGDIEVYITSVDRWLGEGVKDSLGGYDSQYFLSADKFKEVKQV